MTDIKLCRILLLPQAEMVVRWFSGFAPSAAFDAVGFAGVNSPRCEQRSLSTEKNRLIKKKAARILATPFLLADRKIRT
jgi:hypothetical protein